MGSLINIWCDGSYRQAHKTMGAAWLLANGNGEPPREYSRSLPKLQHDHAHGSDIAELTAFAMALESVADGSYVQVHMDCKNAIDWLTNRKISSKGKRQVIAVVRAFDRAVKAMARMKEIDIIYTADSNPSMRNAHNLSSFASSPHRK